ncbi:hypothetical protein BN946_scf184970.g125 [Trametes cinnabarina]|uniref:Thiamine pyrophosphate enzyme TPP-binding domain-containing protein n=1 Tax=Pycnoporus cinnabarinus TaxID=5643 RepID=A0A060SIM2_PYCCI|nr:hypothetical protein BN946_scf184970.g125 [Trametes cinnabarina]
MYTTASILFKAFAEAGITHAFVNWGNDHPAFLEELERERVEGGKTIVEIVTCPHEMVALSAAQGYAQVTGKPAAVIVHVDVGTQGLAGAVHNVDRGRTPVLIFAGAAPHAKSQPQGPVYLWARRETTEEEIDPSIFNEKLDITKWPPVEGPGLSPAALSTIADALLQARFPLIIAANSGRNPNTVPLLSTLSTLLAIGVFTSCPSAVCIPWTHPNYIGLSFGGKNDLLDHADVIIILDVDIPWIDAVGNKPREDARVFVIDADPLKTTMGWSHVDAELLCRADPEVALSQLIDAIDGPTAQTLIAPEKLSERKKRLADLRSAWVNSLDKAEATKTLGDDQTTPTVPYVLATLRNAVIAQTPSKGEKTLWINESISNYPLTWSYLRPGQPGSMISSGASSLGYALGAAVGAYLGSFVARKEHELIAAVVGDGVFLFGVPASAFWMARRYNTPFLTVILNNGGWFSPKSSMMGVYPDGLGKAASGQQLTVGFGPEMPDYSQVAAAAGGAWGKRVERADDLQSVLEEAVRVVVKEKRSAVVDCIIQSI